MRWIILLGMAACGGGGSHPAADGAVPVDAAVVDSPPDAAPDASGVCNPVTQTGCAAAEKCTVVGVRAKDVGG